MLLYPKLSVQDITRHYNDVHGIKEDNSPNDKMKDKKIVINLDKVPMPVLKHNIGKLRIESDSKI